MKFNIIEYDRKPRKSWNGKDARDFSVQELLLETAMPDTHSTSGQLESLEETLHNLLEVVALLLEKALSEEELRDYFRLHIPSAMDIVRVG